MPDPLGPIADAFPFIFGGIVVVIILGVVIAIISVVRNHRKIRQAGYDPMTLQAELATRAMGSRMMSGEKSLADRLSELDELRATNAISADEHAAARAEVLGGR